MTNITVVAHSPIEMKDSSGEVVMNVSPGDEFPARIGDSSNFIDMLMGLSGALLVDFGIGESAYSMTPDANGDSYANWFDIKEGL